MKSFPLLAALAASMGASNGDGFGLPPMVQPRKRYVPKPVDHEAECRKFDGLKLRHRVTGNVRKVLCCTGTVVFADYTSGRGFTRDYRKALDWIRNADVVGGES